MSIWVWIGIGLLGGSFSIVRFLIDAVISSRIPAEFPWGTFTVNVSGSFALGILSAQLAGNALVLAGTACVGSYTTFSTWMLEADRLGEDDGRRPLVFYLLGSLAVGLVAAACGRILGHSL
jgi:fluoride exporter